MDLVFHLMVGSKKGVSAHQMHRMLELTYKTAWFMCHRIREAMSDGKLAPPLGGMSRTVEIDEAYIGGKEGNKNDRANAPLVARVGRARHQLWPSWSVVAVSVRSIFQWSMPRTSSRCSRHRSTTSRFL